MTRFVLAELRSRARRALALGTGVVVASVCFTLLTAAVGTSELRLRGTIERNFGGAYHILVRPVGSYGDLERSHGLVAANFASGIFGGISRSEWREIMRIPGVEVAAPVANLGYVAPFVLTSFGIRRFLNDEEVQLYRVRTTWVAEQGLSRYPGQRSFVYFTRRNPILTPSYAVQDELLPSGKRLPVCAAFYDGKPLGGSSPFRDSSIEGWFIQCFSERSPEAAEENIYPFDAGGVGSGVNVLHPVLLAAIDPDQEEALLGVGDSIVSGRPLRRTDAVGGRPGHPVVPVIAASRTYVDQPIEVAVDRLAVPPGVDVPRTLASPRAFDFVTGLDGRELGTFRLSSQALYRRELESLSRSAGGLQNYWEVGPVAYEGAGTTLRPRTRRNEDSVYSLPCCGASAAPGNQDVQFRILRNHQRRYFRGEPPSDFRLEIVGRFDPLRIRGFTELADVPLGAYSPPTLRGADERSRRLLDDAPLRPSMNLGGYIQQPPLLLTTMDALRFFTDRSEWEGTHRERPISVIRVKVEGVRGPDELSLARIREVARLIRTRIGLAVDIVAGSSPSPIRIRLPAGRYGRPALTLHEAWVKKHVAVSIIRALDRKSLLLFLLVLTVTGLFLVNGALASVRSRRSEIGTLAAFGWTRRAVFSVILAELLLVGLIAGLVGTALAFAVIEALALEMPSGQALLVAPIAVLVTGIAGVIPAWLASRTVPIEALRPPVSARSSSSSVRTLAQMAAANLRRLPGRTIVGAAGIFIGVAALTFLLAVNQAFSGSLVGSLLGNVIAVDVRGVDVVSVALALGLSALCVADVLLMNIRERAAELVTLSAGGWGDRHLGALVSLEGIGLGILGGVPGALLGSALAGAAGGFGAGVAIAGVLGAAGAVGLAAIGSLLPAIRVSRMLAPSTLAEE